nr:hypothetical protein [Otoolea muris]
MMKESWTGRELSKELRKAQYPSKMALWSSACASWQLMSSYSMLFV